MIILIDKFSYQYEKIMNHPGSDAENKKDKGYFHFL
ncbi:hypothetical protein ALO_07483 [Acetonema longum DSM 6540]|uniref:Uncharacterized protein n=1 Tax=Acetonema longum DSM 6540 TaxID=1009370 RepID=F7NHF1_9FIRM|nr:hypothetical protein ALO_07483 [Acetonema longum DSM 6540]